MFPNTRLSSSVLSADNILVPILSTTSSSPACINHFLPQLNSLLELLKTNTHHIISKTLKETRMIALLDHNYNCYDQIEFIVKEVCTNRIANDNERLIEYFIRMIVNEKQLVQAMGKWIDLNSFEMLQRAMKTEVDYSRRKIIGKCKICQRSIERVNIREAREQILCEGIGEDIFEQEFMYTKEQFESQPVVVESAPMTTITYLSKTIEEMERQAANYHQWEQSIKEEKDDNEVTVTELIQNLLANVQKEIGKGYIKKVKMLLSDYDKKFEESLKEEDYKLNEHQHEKEKIEELEVKTTKEKQIIVSKSTKKTQVSKEAQLETSKQKDHQNVRQETEKNSEKKLIQELFDEKISLTKERNNYKSLYDEACLKLKDVLKRNSKKRDSIFSKVPTTVIIPNEDDPAASVVREESNIEITAKKLNNFERKVSIFNTKQLRDGHRQWIQESEGHIDEKVLHGKSSAKYILQTHLEHIEDSSAEECESNSVGKSERDQERRFVKEVGTTSSERRSRKSLRSERLSQILSMQTKTILEQTQQETKKMYKDAECQCELIDAAGDSSAKKGKNNDKEKNKERKNVKGSKNHKKNTSNMIESEEKELSSFYQGHGNRNISSSKQKIATESTKKFAKPRSSLLKPEKLKTMENMTKTDSNTIDARQDSVYKFVSPNYKTRISKKSLTPFSTTNTNKQLYNKSAANESQLPQMSSVNKENEVSKSAHQEDSETMALLFGNNLGKLKQQQKKSRRHQTELDELSQPAPKHKINKLFVAENLELFGGVAESYRFEEQVDNKNSNVKIVQNTAEIEYRDILYTHINNLKHYQNNIYENIVSFLTKPFKTIETNKIQESASIEKLKFALDLMLNWHKLHCGEFNCSHLTKLLLQIGLPEL